MVIAKEHLCFAACVEIAVKHLGGPTVDQVVLAQLLGVTVPTENDASKLRNDGVTQVMIDPTPHLWGMNPHVEQLNEAFARAGVSVSATFHPIAHFQDWEFEEQLVTLTRERQFPVVCFDYNTLFGERVRGDQGHCCVVVECTTRVRIYDPGPLRAGFSSIDMFDLYRACRRKPGGLWVFSRDAP